MRAVKLIQFHTDHKRDYDILWMMQNVLNSLKLSQKVVVLIVILA